MNNQAILEEQNIKLPEVKFSEAQTIYKAFKERASKRNMTEKEFTLQEISNIMWAACGINRDNGRSTAPLLWEHHLYIANRHGIHKYDAQNNQLNKVLEEDIRAKMAFQDFVQKAPIIIILAVNTNDMSNDWLDRLGGKDFYAANQTSVVSQNIYLCAAAMDISTVAMTYYDKKFVDDKLGFTEGMHSYIIHPIGHGK
ncbi:MAG: hypothetical protein C0594_02015 [Marinilabiliales bacterium]|nr:MAG: hypothetical protein C0594_02015 [Marinilabiliales bacterium]